MSYPVCPSHRVVRYTLDSASGWYVKEPQRIAFGKLPVRLKVEETQDPRIRANGARELIHGPEENGKWKFFTGLVPFGVASWYEGNAYEHRNGKGTRSLVLFRFTDHDANLTVFYFTGWYINSREERLKFARSFAQHVEEHGAPENDEGHLSAPRLSSMPHMGDATCSTV